MLASGTRARTHARMSPPPPTSPLRRRPHPLRVQCPPPCSLGAMTPCGCAPQRPTAEYLPDAMLGAILGLAGAAKGCAESWGGQQRPWTQRDSLPVPGGGAAARCLPAAPPPAAAPPAHCLRPNRLLCAPYSACLPGPLSRWCPSAGAACFTRNPACGGACCSSRDLLKQGTYAWLPRHHTQLAHVARHVTKFRVRWSGGGWRVGRRPRASRCCTWQIGLPYQLLTRAACLSLPPQQVCDYRFWRRQGAATRQWIFWAAPAGAACVWQPSQGWCDPTASPSLSSSCTSTRCRLPALPPPTSPTPSAACALPAALRPASRSARCPAPPPQNPPRGSTLALCRPPAGPPAPHRCRRRTLRQRRRPPPAPAPTTACSSGRAAGTAAGPRAAAAGGTTCRAVVEARAG